MPSRSRSCRLGDDASTALYVVRLLKTSEGVRCASRAEEGAAWIAAPNKVYGAVLALAIQDLIAKRDCLRARFKREVNAQVPYEGVEVLERRTAAAARGQCMHE